MKEDSNGTFEGTSVQEANKKKQGKPAAKKRNLQEKKRQMNMTEKKRAATIAAEKKKAQEILDAPSNDQKAREERKKHLAKYAGLKEHTVGLIEGVSEIEINEKAQKDEKRKPTIMISLNNALLKKEGLTLQEKREQLKNKEKKRS